MSKKIVVIAAFSHPEYKEKKKKNKAYIDVYWDCALHIDGHPIDVVDYYKLKHPTKRPRHVYNNGIVLSNYFRQKGALVHLINSMSEADEHDWDEIRQANAVVISTGYPGYGKRLDNIVNLSKEIKKHNPNIQILIGGWEIYRALRKQDPWYDKFLKELYKAGADNVIGSRQGLEIAWKYIDEYPLFRGVLYDKKDYPPVDASLYSVNNLPKKYQSTHTAITTTDGCPFNCNFCSYKILHDKISYLEISDIKNILDNLHKNRQTPLKHIRLADECLNYPYERIIQICELIKNLPYDFKWSCFIRVGNVDKKMAKAMSEARCEFVSMGVESGDEAMRKRMNKFISNDDIRKAIELFKKYGIKSVLSLIVGYYGENDESLENTKNMLEKLQPDIAKINIWYPTPDEMNNQHAHTYKLHFTDKGWQHDTMNEKTAYAKAAWLYRETKKVAFSPPFISVFDLWPWFQGEGLNSEKIMNIIWDYYNKSKK